jgi:hypothetical protein
MILDNAVSSTIIDQRLTARAVENTGLSTSTKVILGVGISVLIIIVIAISLYFQFRKNGKRNENDSSSDITNDSPELSNINVQILAVLNKNPIKSILKLFSSRNIGSSSDLTSVSAYNNTITMDEMVAIQKQTLKNVGNDVYLSGNVDIESSGPLPNHPITTEEENIQIETNNLTSEPEDSFQTLESLESPTHNPWV